MRRAVPEFSLQKELADPEMRRLMQLPGMRMLDAYRLAHYGDAMRQTARTVEQGVVERIRQRGARPAENGTHPGSAAVTGADVNRMTRSPAGSAWSVRRSMVQRSVFEGKPSHRFGLALPAPCGAPPKGELEINERKDNDYEQLQHSAVCRQLP